MATTKKKTSVTKKSTAKKPSTIHHRSLSRSSQPEFMTFKFTQQTLYWIIIGALIIALSAWVLSLTIQIQNIYDNIDELRADTSISAPKHH
jgi:hypothetical protein